MNQIKKFYITTPIYYPNARPHVGSAYTTIACDAIARYKRMCGYDVAFLTGTDEHGEKLQRAADEAGVPVEKFVAEKRELFKELWRTLGLGEFQSIESSNQWPNESMEQAVPAIKRLFVHTSQNPDHVKSVQWMIRQAKKAGYIEKKKYEGRYCVFDERYVSDSPEPVNCDICGRPAELISEENYFFKLSAFQERLLKHYEDHRDFVQPDFRMNEVKSFVKSGLRDISISRRRLKWGIPWPDDPDQVVYVWYDALTSYLTGIGFAGEKRSKDFEKYWPADVHMIGKDILRFHAVYWPAFLWAAGLPLPKTIFAHGWIYYEQDKMSKSKGNVVYPEPIIKAFEEFSAPGSDALRYYLLRDTPFGQDGSFSYEGLIQRYNSDLANDLGNLANRTVAMIDRYCGGRVPKAESSPANVSEENKLKIDFFRGQVGQAPLQPLEPFFRGRQLAHLKEAQESGGTAATKSGLCEWYRTALDSFDLALGVVLVWSGISKVNGYLVEQEPWKLAESKKSEDLARLHVVLYTAADLVRTMTTLLYPVLPESTRRIWGQLGCEGRIEDQRLDDLKWGGLKPGTKVGKPVPIFPRLDKEKTLARLRELAEEDRVKGEKAKEAIVESSSGRKPQTPVKAESKISDSEGQKITIDDFAKVDLRAGTIVSAEPIAGATKLLKLQVDIGTEVRQVCAGIAEYYKPEELVGMKVVIVANLQPRKMRGVESNGMIVAASVGESGRPILATFREDVPNGAKLK
ncbi:MAG TPA: methionine--tRNA ligase subunit beta [Terriglobia bacterium]|nr:methionine--tRNA ligase subunit beta [Terriglobia bacterium]